MDLFLRSINPFGTQANMLSPTPKTTEMRSFANDPENKENPPSFNLGIGKFYEHSNSVATKREIHDVHVEIKKQLDFYVSTRSWIPKTFHVECKMNGQWQTLVLQEANSVEITLQGQESKKITVNDVSNFTDMHKLLMQELH